MSRRIFAIGDLHLSFANPKPMDVFGEEWAGHEEKVAEHWAGTVGEEDIVLVPGDVSWAMKPEAARLDLEWLARLPGTKVLLRGNHDYWWGGISHVRRLLDEVGRGRMHAVQNDCCVIDDVAVAGTRLWVAPDLTLKIVPFRKREPKVATRRVREAFPAEQNAKIWRRELERLRLSLKAMPEQAAVRIVMTHFPPVNPAGEGSEAADLIEEAGPRHCVFGHLHGVDREALPCFNVARNGVEYRFVSADYLDFTPLRIV